MSENQRLNDVSVDRRDETVVTRIIWAILGLLEILLGLRFLLKLVAANPEAGFAVFIYGITKPLIAPFALLVGTPTAGGVIFEATTLIAMAVYALLFWGIVSVIGIAANRPIARTSTRSTREQTPDGGDRTTHTTTRG